MSLTQNDLSEIRNIVSEALEPVRGDIKALSNDIKEIYRMISDLQKSSITDKKFKRQTIEKKLLTLNAELIDAARQVGITLPR